MLMNIAQNMSEIKLYKKTINSTNIVKSTILIIFVLLFGAGCVAFPSNKPTMLALKEQTDLNTKIPEEINASNAYFFNSRGKGYAYSELVIPVIDLDKASTFDKYCINSKMPHQLVVSYTAFSVMFGFPPSYARYKCELELWYGVNKIARLEVNGGHLHIIGVPLLGAMGHAVMHGRSWGALQASEALAFAYSYLPLETRRKLYQTDLDFVENELTDEQAKEFYAELDSERRRVVFNGDKPRFSPWYQALPYSGVSSGNALVAIKNHYEAIATAYLRLADKQTQIPEVLQPEVPPAITLDQSPYETNRVFEQRIQETIEERNNRIVELQELYQQQVAERNARIDALNQLQKQRQAQLKDNKIEFMADAMRAELLDFKVRNASFDQATALLYFDLYSTNSDYQELIAIETHDPVITERLAENPEQIQPEVTFRIEGDGFSLQQVTLKAGAISEVAQVMAAKNVTSRGQQRVVIDSSKLEAASGIAAVAGLQKQNPNIVDRFRTGVITYNNGKTEQRETGLDNDELWLAVQDLRNSRLNDNAFLFVIGIEDYKNAAPVPYAENSALVTKELLRVKAGAPDKNVYLLTQDKTTGTQIRGELSKMLGRLDSDSLVYFYYAGHGVPDISNNESVYLLPADAVQGFYQDDNFKLDNIMRQIAARQPQHAYFFLDTCFSGRVNRNELLFPGVGALMVETIKPKVPENVTVFYGGQGTQFANAFDDKRHRLMSYYLAKGVLDGKDSISELSSYVNRAVRKESLVKGGDFRQEPFIDGATEGRLFRTAAAR